MSRAVQHEEDGTFVVFRPNGQIGELVLAIK